MYGTLCPLCRKTPVPIVNPETLQLEFELVTNGVDPSHTLPGPSAEDNVANYTDKCSCNKQALEYHCAHVLCDLYDCINNDTGRSLADFQYNIEN